MQFFPYVITILPAVPIIYMAISVTNKNIKDN